MEERRLHPGLGEEELRHTQPRVDRSCDRRREHVRTGPPREACRLCVDVGDAAGIGVEPGQRDDLGTHRRDAERGRCLGEAAWQLDVPCGPRAACRSA